MKRVLVSLFLLLVSCTDTVNVETINNEKKSTLPPPALATSSPPNAEITADKYLSAWETGDFAAMYNLLSPLSQDATSIEDFVATYQSVNDSASLVRIETNILSAQQNNSEAKVQFDLALYSSIVGKIQREITIPLLLKNGKWTINWDPSLILPELANGNNLYMDYVIPSRANIYDRNDLAFAAHTNAVSIGVIPGEIDSAQEDQLLKDLSPLISRHPEAIKSLYASSKPDWYVPLGEASANEIKAIYLSLIHISEPTRPY